MSLGFLQEVGCFQLGVGVVLEAYFLERLFYGLLILLLLIIFSLVYLCFSFAFNFLRFLFNLFRAFFIYDFDSTRSRADFGTMEG